VRSAPQPQQATLNNATVEDGMPGGELEDGAA